ncbi:hypothetical protein HLB44_07400 [Aquincola sp. S2]|uniref:Uncharacterized protein n=1 Tax=Pseudaquabacterium terrae TaxID=2732868 RepID=A0ABX2EDW8_9BURK|nr:hypothetical protein [Aquabacterium terrae]NRF66804.1 hypothetical protein [Aquabacterium terrae]
MAIPSFSSTVVARAAAALYGIQLGNATMTSVLAEANLGGGGIGALINGVYARDFGTKSAHDVAVLVTANLGITGAGVTDAVAYLENLLNTTPAAERGMAIADAAALFSGLTSDGVYGAAASAFNGRIASAVAYAQTAGTIDRPFNAGASLGMTMGQDFLSGTPGNDVIQARIFNNSNSWQSGDWTDGGAGNDRIEADMGSSAVFSVTPETTGVEQIAVRAQSHQTDSGDNNVSNFSRVQIDAERIVGATRFESNNSRADLIFEDVRILPSQITKDITIAMVETDPGHVDYAVYFDQYSLKNQVSNTSSINLQIMDTVAAAAGLAPLLNSNYGAFTFTVTIGGVARTVTLGSQAIQDAQTYAQLAAAFQTALNAEFGAGVATATVGDNFTVVDPASRIAVTGQNIVLTTNTLATFSTPAGSGWLADGVAPPASNFYTNFFTGTTASASLVTSTVILDDVGRGSTGGELVIGGLSVGTTSSSLGVQRFEIEVRDNSKLESINSTNNTLREVTIVNGVTTSSSHAYVPTVQDAGNLTVNGNAGANGANVSGSSGRVPVSTITDAATAPGNNAINGVQSTTNVLAPITTFGFSDVRLIDASTMRGKFEFTAQVTASSLAKYLNLKDIQSNPAGDNIAFTYNGGTNDDTMWVRLDTGFAASRNTIMVGREDFTFTANGGTGNDWINVALTPTPGGDQAWYTNQKLNKNLTINGDAGDDVIRKPGAGDFIINGGTGLDTVYADNSGTQAIAAGNASLAGAVYTAAEAAELAAALALANLANSTNDGAAVAPQPANTGNPNPLGQADTTVAALNTLDLFLPVTFVDPADATLPLVVSHANLKTQIDNAYAAGALTVAQQQALYVAYNVASAGTIITPATLVARPDITDEVAVAGNLTAAEFAAGNAVLDGYLVAARAAAATADAADARVATEAGLLNATQLAVVNAQLAVNGVFSWEADETIAGINLNGNGTAVVLNGLTALRTALVLGATDAAVLAALVNARDNQIITDAEATALLNASISGGAGTVDAAELFAIQVILEPMIATATALNTAANDALTAAIAANNTAVRTAAGIVGADPFTAAASAVANDFVGSTEAAAAATAAQTALTAFNNATLNPALALQAALAALKSAIAVGVSDLNVTLLTAAAVAAGTITAGDKVAIDNASGATPTAAADTVNLTEKNATDVLITALQVANNAVVAQAQQEAATLTAIRDATAFASAQALAAANASPGAGTGPFDATSSRAVWVLNTASQAAVSTAPGTPYVLAVNDERNVFDLKSDANNTYNFFAARVTVTFKDITASVEIPNTGFRTSDLQINQAIKDAINNNVVLNKLISATDGPANTLVITSLIDGVMSNANFGVALTLPALAGIVDVAGAAAVYGTASTAEAVLAAMTTALAAFNTKGDYVDQLAETGAFGGNAQVTGAASVTTSDNTITPGDGNDVTVLGTTVGTDALLSSNDRVVFGANFGNDTVVHFQAGAQTTGGDVLVLAALGGSILGTAFNVNNSINVANETTANDTAAEIAALFADSATAQTHVYIAVDILTNIGKVYTVSDAAGTAAGNVTATLAGTIDLADTLWSTLTADNFA